MTIPPSSMTNDGSGQGPLVRIQDLVVATHASAPPVLKGVDLDVEPGATVGIVGESGSGKTTLARSIVCGLSPGLRIMGGSVHFDGVDVGAMTKRQLLRLRQREVGFVFQEAFAALDPSKRVGDQLLERLALAERLPRREAMARVTEALAAVGLKQPVQRLRQYPNEFSGGMLQRAVIAMATLTSPRLIIADEPTSALDITTAVGVLDQLVKRVREQQASLILVSHDLGVVRYACDETVVMHAGQVVERAATRQVLESPQHPYTRQLLGSYNLAATQGA